MISVTRGSSACQRIDSQVLRTDTIERRQRGTRNVIETIRSMSAFKRPQIGDIRHYHDDRGIAPRVSADGAGFCVSMLPQV
jgi:hypothetical protein